MPTPIDLDEIETDAELDDLRAQVRHERKYNALLARHPDCRDPEHPTCSKCAEPDDPEGDDTSDDLDSQDED